jgi:mono/diheme cytochrome c family protein
MKRLIVVLAGAALLAAPAAAQDNNTLKAVGQGRALYLVNCAGCHGADVKGTTAGTNGGAPDLTLIAVRDGEFKALHVAGHIVGRRDGMKNEKAMPCWGRAFKERWPRGEGAAALQVYKLSKYIAFVQEQSLPQRVASK